MASAPVCHVPSTADVGQPEPKQFPSIPQATDLASAIAAINAMRNILQQMLGQLNPNNTSKGGGSSGFKTKNDPSKKSGPGFIEVHRVTSKVRVYNPQDKTQYVDVERINQLVLRDKVSGALWVWNR